MKILNINLHFYPESIGGATVVAEKLAWGLTQAGHEVTSTYLSLPHGSQDFLAVDTPFGRSIGIKNIPHSPANRFFNPAATSILREIVSIIDPDRIFVHAAQNMGVLELLDDPVVRKKTCIIAHDFFWVCLQGFRRLSGGTNCGLTPGQITCRQCAWYPGLTDSIYSRLHEILADCRAVIFPSDYLHSEYVRLLGVEPVNFLIQSNPDQAEIIIPDKSVLPPAPGQQQKLQGKTTFGFVGGPGETKGWGLVRSFMQRANEMEKCPDGPHVVLFDLGRGIDAPWYPSMEQPGTTIADPYHWSFAGHVLGQIDVMLMPSQVQESCGLAAREILSLGKKCIIRPSGALAELQDCQGVITARDNEDIDSLLLRLDDNDDEQRMPWLGTSSSSYAHRLISL